MLLQSSGRIDAECEVVATGLGPAEWQEVDRRLREYARHRSALDAAETFDLVRAEQLKIYVSFGFVSLYEYLERVLGYKPHTARERMRVARALAALPETTAALARGALSYSAVRELTRVATAETQSRLAGPGRGPRCESDRESGCQPPPGRSSRRSDRSGSTSSRGAPRTAA